MELSTETGGIVNAYLEFGTEGVQSNNIETEVVLN
jgi:hypothetical protein